jgi:WD40 repeat protein
LPEVRDQAITALGLTDLRVQWQRPIGPVMSIRCDARLERYAVVDFRTRDLVVRRLEDDRELLRLPPPKVPFWYAQPIFSPDGRYLSACYYGPGDSGKGLLQVWRLGNKEPVFSQPVCSREGRTFHPDGRRLLFCPAAGGLAIWDLDAGREVKRLPLSLTPYAVCLASDGRRVAVNNRPEFGAPLVKLLDLETGQELASWKSQVGNTAMAWSADGQLLAIGHDDGQVYVWDVPRGRLASVLQGHTARVIDCHFAHEGHLLATYAWGSTTRLWDAASGETLAMATGILAGPFSPDDHRLPFFHNVKLGVWEVDRGQQCRTLHPGMIGNRTAKPRAGRQIIGADVSADGRLLAAACWDGVRLYDGNSGQELAFLPVGYSETVLFHPDGKSLIGYGRTGLYAWPICLDAPAGADVRRVGPPQLLHRANQPQWYKAAWMPGHRTLAVIDNGARRVWFVDLTEPQAAAKQWTWLPSKHHRMTSITVSPDGRWAAAGGERERGIQVWNVPERRLERVLVPGDGAGDKSFAVTFSPDGRWLVSHTQNVEAPGYYFWQVGTWKRELVIPSPDYRLMVPPAFTRDGRLMALHLSPQQILLADAATGRAIAHLSTLQPFNPAPLAFSPDGTRLVASTNQSTLLLWDLRAVRKELAQRDLDWAQRPYPPPSPLAPHASRLQFVVYRNWVQCGLDHERQGQAEQALAAYRKAAADYARAFAAADPKSAGLANPLLWFQHACLDLQIGDQAGYRKLCARMLERFGGGKNLIEITVLAHTCLLHPESPAESRRALELAQERAAMRADAWSGQLLGLAYYRAGQLDKAVECLEGALRDNPAWDKNVFNWLVLAMAHHRLGHAAESKQWLKKADRWIADKIRCASPETGFVPPGWLWRDWMMVRLLRREAESLLLGTDGDRRTTQGK